MLEIISVWTLNRAEDSSCCSKLHQESNCATALHYHEPRFSPILKFPKIFPRIPHIYSNQHLEKIPSRNSLITDLNRCENRSSSSGRLQGGSSTPSVIQFQNLPKPTLKTTKSYKNISNTSIIISVKFQLKIRSGNPWTSISTKASMVNVPGGSNRIFVLSTPKPF